MFLTDELQSDSARFMQVAASDAELRIHDGRIVKHEILFAGGRTILGNGFEWLLGKRFGEIFGISDGGGAADEARAGAIEFTNAFEAAQDIGQMAPIDAAVHVQFVNNDVAKIFKELGPFGVVRKNAGVEHVRVRHDDVGFVANGAAGVGGSVAIVSVATERTPEGGVEALEFEALIFGEGFGGEQEDGACGWNGEDFVNNRQVVAERFAASGRRDDDVYRFSIPRLARAPRNSGFRLSGKAP